MTSSTPTLSALGLTSYALRQVPRHFGALAGLLAPAILILIAAAALVPNLWPQPVPNSEEPVASGGAAAMLLIAIVAANLALIPALTGWHRLIVLPDPTRANGRLYGWSRVEWRYLGKLLAIWLVTVVVNIIGGVVLNILGGSPFATVLLNFLLLVAAAFVWAHMGLALPATAIGGNPRFREVGELVGENLTRIALGLFAVWFVAGIFITVIILGAFYIGEAIGSSYIIYIAAVCSYFVAIFASAAVLSRAYTLLTGMDD